MENDNNSTVLDNFEVPIMDSPSPSEEIILLDDSTPAVGEADNGNTVNITQEIEPATEVSESNDNVSDQKPELKSNDTEIEKKKKRNRTRSKSRRMKANSTHVNPHSTVLAVLDTPSKRSRETGTTPPSVTQSLKKIKSLDSRAKQPVVSTGESSAQVPPVQEIAQSSGSKKAKEKPCTQQTVDKPPASKPNKQLSGNSSNRNDKSKEDDDTTYAAVASSLCAAIVDQRSTGAVNLMDQRKFDTLSSLITDKILEHAGNNKIKLPVIEDSRLFGGVLRIRCANTSTRQWLDNFVPTFDKKKLWAGANLAVLDFNNIPKPHKVQVLFRGLKKPQNEIFQLLECLNGIRTKGWSVLHCETKYEGTHMTIGMDTDSFVAIRKRSNKLFYGLGEAEFRACTGCRENRSILQKGDNRPSLTKPAVVNKEASTSSTNPAASEEMDIDEQVPDGGGN